MQKCPRNCTMNTKSSNFVKKWTKFQTIAQKSSKVHFIQEIWCSNRETGRFHEKLGDSRENRESWQVWVWVNSTQTKNYMWGQPYLLIYCLYLCFSYSLQLELCSETHSLWVATTNSTINNWVRLLLCSKPFQNLKF